MKILTLSGSARNDSSNVRLLEALPVLFPEYHFRRYEQLAALPLFTANLQNETKPESVKNWQNALNEAEAVIICTPEYIHNLPALLKNALEWVTASGELAHKKVLAISFTPHPPRGEKAMQSLIWSLQALEANVVAQLPLYQNELHFADKGNLLENEAVEMLREAILLLGS